MYGWKDCYNAQDGRGRLIRFFSCAPVGFDAFVRLTDFHFNRSFGGWSERFIGAGHSPLALLIPALLLFYVVFGPNPNLASIEAWVWFIVSLLVLAGTFRLSVGVKRRRLAAFQVALVLLACLVVFYRGEVAQASGGMYDHLLLAAIPLLLLPGLLVARWLSRSLAKGIDKDLTVNFAEELRATELFVQPPYPKLDGWDILRSLVHAPLQRPLATLWLPAVVVVLRPSSQDLWWWFGGALAFAWLLSSFAGVHRRVDAFWTVVRRIVAVGGQGLLSLLVLSFAALRLAEVTYVTTVLDQISWSTLVPMFLTAYGFFWFYEYWTNRFLSEDLLALIGGEARTGRIRYDFQKNERDEKDQQDPRDEDGRRPAVLSDHRHVAIHAAARFVAVRDAPAQSPVFQFYERADLFASLAGDTNAEDVVRHRIRVYFALTTACILLLVTGLTVFNFRYVAQEPAATFKEAPQGKITLGDLMRDKQQVVLLAASGGGTRAAMYTTALMRGLHEIGALKDLVLLSGVSGGGVSLAYYAGHREALMNDTPGAWKAYGRVVGEPFIQEVLQGFGEWRIARGVRTGKLLQESFGRHFSDEFSSASTFGELGSDLGLILNTSLAGSLDLSHEDYSECGASAFTACAHEYERLTTVKEGGGRLIFTNLRFQGELGRRVPSSPPEIRLPYVVVADPKVKLTDAAALHANFPPVFPNAPVDDRDARKRYWVTDGGTVENRGLVSVLLALQDALECPSGCEGDDKETCPKWPEIHVVLAEASGGKTKFSQDRGFITALAGRVTYANQVIEGLMDDIQTLSKDRVQLHYLVMPRALNVDGGIGTHWMRQEEIVLSQPSVPDPDKREELRVKAADVFDVVYNLYRGPGRADTWYEPFQDAASIDEATVEKVWKRVKEDTDYGLEWKRLITALAPANPN